jgi:hypothetical protein
VTAPVPDRSLRDAIAATTCWFDDDRARGSQVAAAAIDRDPIGFVDSLGALLTVVHDVCREDRVDLTRIVRDIALGVAHAETEGVDDDRPGGRS